MKHFALGDGESLIISKWDLIHCSPMTMEGGAYRDAILYRKKVKMSPRYSAM